MFSCKWRGCLWHGSTTNEQICKRLVARGVCIQQMEEVCLSQVALSLFSRASRMFVSSVNKLERRSQQLFLLAHAACSLLPMVLFSCHTIVLCWYIECNISIARHICVSGRMYGLCEESDHPDSRNNNPLYSRSHFFSFFVKCNFPYFTCELWPFPWQAMLLSYSVEGELL